LNNLLIIKVKFKNHILIVIERFFVLKYKFPHFNLIMVKMLLLGPLP
jgi:hypothetical protein